MAVMKKGAFCTDIHFGKKSNSKLHNEDCIRFLKWFKKNVEEMGDVDYIGFLGDWHENRRAIDIDTLNYSFEGARILDSIGLPVYFVVGNHDLGRRHTRDIHSIIPYSELKNFIIVDEPLVSEDIGDGMLWSPYLFHSEYPDLQKYLNIPVWAGHFEFQGFVITGQSGTLMNAGPLPTDYQGPRHIFSGHFHKRQAHEQVIYMGNCFPMDFGDAGDNARGMMTYDHEKDEVTFFDWEDCPSYIKTTISALVEDDSILRPDARVKCIVDIPLTYNETLKLRSHYTDAYGLRDFIMEESRELHDAMTGTDSEIKWDETTRLKGVNELVIEMLNEIDSDQIDNSMLVQIYRGLTAA
jgi:DNA repair exonuclease SbcCD nuclease subunit